MTQIQLLFLTMILLVSATACSASATSTAGPEVQTLTVDEFAEILDNQSDAYTVINVHIPYEGEVEGTDAHIPYNDVEALTAALPDKDAPIILYCRTGRMSEEATEALAARGYSQVWDVPGGMQAWERAGLPLQNR